ncbi:MAG: hypothetical protein ACJ763_19740 [Bdellovibrionia bacterium]
MAQTKNPKTETFLKISHAVFQLEESQGHLRWKVTDLVRKVKLSRSLVYAYMGSSKKEILLSALRHFINDFYGFDDSKSPTSSAKQIQRARERIIHYPEAVIFYQKWRARESWLQLEFAQIEKRFQQQIKDQHPTLTEIQILGVHATIHGLVTAPFLTSQQAEAIYKETVRRLCNQPQ